MRRKLLLISLLLIGLAFVMGTQPARCEQDDGRRSYVGGYQDAGKGYVTSSGARYPIRMPFFSYGNYNQLSWSEFTTAIYDSIASNDIQEFHIDFFDENAPAITDSLRLRNPNIILLNYIPLLCTSQ